MKTLLTLTTAAMLALPLFAADEPKKKETPAPAATATAQTPAPAAGDSPLVAASKARRARRNASRIVITNETLAKTGGNAHITTTAVQQPIRVPPPPAKTPEQLMAERKAEQRRVESIRAAEQAKVEKERQTQIELTRTILEDDDNSDENYDTDPAQSEHRAEEASKKTNEQKPPHR